jgi:surfeit locus 1 family protein
MLGFASLGTWQVQRRAWKHALLARIDARVHADPGSPPPAADWPGASAARDEFLRVRVTGRWEAAPPALVLASTKLGTGHWVLSALRREDGSCLLVNRGFVADGSDPAPAQADAVEVTGLLRMSEPGGLWLRHNDPANDHWFSRDVQAIAARRGLQSCAPWFVDAQEIAGPARTGEDRGAAPAAPPANPLGTGASMPATEARERPFVVPVPGLTVLDLPDNHAIYALTWFSLAALSLGGALAFALTPRQRPAGGP